MTITVDNPTNQGTALAGLLSEVSAVLARHPLGQSFKLVFAPNAIGVPEGWTLVQRDTVGGKIEFVPVPIEECQLTDTSYEILVFDPNDSTFKAYAGIPRPARVCIVGDSVHTHG